MLGVERAALFALIDVWAIATVLRSNDLAICRIETNRAWQRQQEKCIINRERLNGHVFEQRNHLCFFHAGWRSVERAPHDVRAVLASFFINRQTIFFTNRFFKFWAGQYFDCRFDRQFVGGHAVGDTGSLLATPYIRTKFARTGLDHVSTYWVKANMKCVERCGINVFDVVLNKWLETWQLFAVSKIKLCKPCIAHALAFGDLIQLFFNSCSKCVVDKRRKIVGHQLDHGKRCPGWNKCLTLLPHVAAVDDRAKNRRIC